MEKKSTIDKFDSWLDRIKKYLLIIIAFTMAVWGVALAWGGIIEMMEDHEKLKERVDKSNENIINDFNYKYERVDRVIKRKESNIYDLIEDLNHEHYLTDKKIENLRIELINTKVNQARENGYNDAYREILKEIIKAKIKDNGTINKY